jgi:two-component system sensor histidine kinase KdpD
MVELSELPAARRPAGDARVRRYALSALACIGTALVATPLRAYLDAANIVMLFMLTVLVVALRAGRGPAVMASFLCVALFDFFFVPPRFSFAVDDVQYIVTFGVMLAVALITAHLTAGLRLHADLAARRERETQSLYELARDLAGAASTEHVAMIAERFLLDGLGMHAVLLLPNDEGELTATNGDPARLAYLEHRLAQRAYERGEPMGVNALADTDQAVAYVPLKARMRVRGTLAVTPATRRRITAEAIGSLLPAVASLVAIAIERLHYVDVANRAQLDTASERLRNSILTALSHDVRTPLTALVGLADSLTVIKPPLPDAARETAAALREQAVRMNGMVSNLLDMARLSAGHVTLRKEWQLIEEVAGAAVQLLGRALAGHRVIIELPPTLPLLEFDAVLVERVLCNLLENAAKYSPAGSTIAIGARVADGFAHVSVSDEGRGFPAGRHEELFGVFVRGERESNVPGTGLGLAICRAIVEAHGGTIGAEDRPGGGAQVTFTLPLGAPPPIEDELPGAADGDRLG